MFEARCVSVAMDDDGLIPGGTWSGKLRENRPKMLYTIPTFQNPSGRTLSLERRRAVAELAERYDVLVLEDDPYRDIRYSGEELPPSSTLTSRPCDHCRQLLQDLLPRLPAGLCGGGGGRDPPAGGGEVRHQLPHLHAAPDPVRRVLQAGLLSRPSPEDLRSVPQAPGRDAPVHRPLFPRRHQAQRPPTAASSPGGAARRHRHHGPAAGSPPPTRR